MNKFLSASCLATFQFALLVDTASADADLTELGLEELLSVKITSVSKKIQSLNDAAAAVFVISN
jgi:iron complex outermembrane receptor protein